MDIRKEIKKLSLEVKVNRRELHKIPELGLETIKTRQYLIDQLSSYGVDEIKCGYAKSGIAVCIKGKNHRSAIAFRSDMDALAIPETTNCDFASQHEGCSHSCGHDGHMANMLALCHYLCLNKEKLMEDIIIVFQPGEEGPGGAKIMMEDGLFKDYPIRCIFGTHLMVDFPVGKIASKSGPLMARNGEITIEIFGQGSHGAAPHLGIDCIVAGSALVSELQTILTRNVDPTKQGVLSIGVFQSGHVGNIIADYALMRGTIRSFDDETYEIIRRRINEIVNGIEVMYDVKIKLLIEDLYHVVNNDESLNTLLKEVVGMDYIETYARMISEDFSCYQKEVPGLFYFTGIQDENFQRSIHDSAFNFNEDTLLYSVETNVRLLEKMEVLK